MWTLPHTTIRTFFLPTGDLMVGTILAGATVIMLQPGSEDNRLTFTLRMVSEVFQPLTMLFSLHSSNSLSSQLFIP